MNKYTFVEREEIREDILKFYAELVKKQREIDTSHLAAGGNLGQIMAAYINSVWGSKN